jgi:hypothetical protein
MSSSGGGTQFKPLAGPQWVEVVSEDEAIQKELRKRALSRHLRNSHSRRPNKRLVLKHAGGSAILVWELQQLSRRKNLGIRCVIFTNDSGICSEDLLMEGMLLARLCWKDIPFFVPMNPGSHLMDLETVFLHCGWKKNLLVNSSSTSASLPVYTCGYCPSNHNRKEKISEDYSSGHSRSSSPFVLSASPC